MVADHLLGHQQCGGEGIGLDLFQVTGHAGGLVAQIDADWNVENEFPARVQCPVADFVRDGESLPALRRAAPAPGPGEGAGRAALVRGAGLRFPFRPAELAARGHAWLGESAGTGVGSAPCGRWRSIVACASTRSPLARQTLSGRRGVTDPAVSRAVSHVGRERRRNAQARQPPHTAAVISPAMSPRPASHRVGSAQRAADRPAPVRVRANRSALDQCRTGSVAPAPNGRSPHGRLGLCLSR